MRWVALAALLVTVQAYALGPQWLLVSPGGQAEAGKRFELVLVTPGEPFPDEIEVRVNVGAAEVQVSMKGEGPAAGSRRLYAGIMPPGATGLVNVQLWGAESNTVMLRVPRRDEMQRLTGRPSPTEEAPLSAEDPVYFVLGYRDGWNARFQLSFKYRLFDAGSGYGAEQPWLSGFHFGYTQSSLWDLSAQSKPFKDTSYRPAFFWRWKSRDDRAWLDATRLGFEHESNGQAGIESRSINMLFVRPEWRWKRDDGRELEFTPKIYSYLDKSENPDISAYRGYVDWRIRYDSGGQWITTAVARVGTAGYGSVLVDLSRRTRDMRIGALSGYLHIQYFNGYGETIVDYNVRSKAQLRIGLAIVP